jgi:hypothetical protein
MPSMVLSVFQVCICCPQPPGPGGYTSNTCHDQMFAASIFRQASRPWERTAAELLGYLNLLLLQYQVPVQQS